MEFSIEWKAQQERVREAFEIWLQRKLNATMAQRAEEVANTAYREAQEQLIDVGNRLVEETR